MKRKLSRSANALLLRRLRRIAVKRGLCRVCRVRYPKAGLKICAYCHARKAERAARYVADGRCACGRDVEPGYKACPSCRASNRRSYKRKQRRLHQLAGGLAFVPDAAFDFIRAAVNQLQGLCACGRQKASRARECSGCALRKTVERISTQRAVRAAR